ncbi:hypothetical protein V8E51_016729 [Hyaloscypha variabilis]
MWSSRSLFLTTYLLFPVSTAAFSLSAWLHDSGYTGSGSPSQEIQCYALPYGILGFISHLLTYWAILCFKLNLTPLFPFRENSEPVHSIFFAVVGLLATVTINILTTIRYRQAWEFVLISLWKMTLSITLSAVTIHAMLVVDRLQKGGGRSWEERGKGVLYWLAVYLLGLPLGLAGLCGLVKEEIATNVPLRNVTVAFAVIGALFFGVTAMFLVYDQVLNKKESGERGFWEGGVVLETGFWVLGSAVAAVGFLMTLYSDFALAAIKGEWSGVPSSDDAVFFWVYWVAKRLPMLSC